MLAKLSDSGETLAFIILLYWRREIMKKYELENIFYEKSVPECGVLTRELIKKLISVTEPVEVAGDSTVETDFHAKKIASEEKRPVIEFLQQHGVDIDTFATGLEANIKGNWFDIFYFDFALKPFFSKEIESVIKKRPEKFQMLVCQIVWCGLKGCMDDRMISSVSDIEISGEDCSELIGMCKKVAIALMEKHEFRYKNFSVFDGYFDMMELKSLLLQLIHVCNLLVPDEEKERQGYKDYLCKNLYPSLSGSRGKNSNEFLPDKLLCKEIINSLDLPGSPKDCFKKLITLALLILMNRSSKIRVNLNKFGLMVFKFIQKDSNYFNPIIKKQGVISGIHENNNVTVNLIKLIRRYLKGSYATTDTQEEILQEVLLKLFDKKIIKYRFMQSLNTFLYNIIREVVAKEPPPLSAPWLNHVSDQDRKTLEAQVEYTDKLTHKTISDACYELLQQARLLEDFDNNARLFISHAARQRKPLDFKCAVIFAKQVYNINDQDIFNNWKDCCKNKQNIKVIRKRIKKSLSERHKVFIRGNNNIKPFNEILSEHINIIIELGKTVKWDFRVDPSLFIKGITFYYLNEIIKRLNAMFDVEALSICFEELLKQEWPVSSEFIKKMFEIK